MNWTQFTIKGKTYCCRHLQPRIYHAQLDGQAVTIQITFGNHCFTDEKEESVLLFPREGRYWSQERYERSKQLPQLIAQALDTNSYCVAHYSNQNEQYHYVEADDYAIFFTVHKPQNSTDRLKIKVVSAYPIEEWGRSAIPSGKRTKRCRINFVLHERFNRRRVLK